MKNNNILNVLRTDKTVFTFKELMLFWGGTDVTLLRRRISYYVKVGDFYHLRRGIYAKNKDYNKLELAAKVYTPAYISFETVLTEAGITFQYYSQIFIASYLTREIICDNQIFSYKKIKNCTLTNHIGIESKSNYSIATKERAFLDVIYLNKNYYFDNLQPLDWDKVFTILPIYENKNMIKLVNKYYQEFKASS